MNQLGVNSAKSFQLLQMTLLILPTVSLAAEKTFVKGYDVTFGMCLVLLANIDCAIDRTGSSRNANRVND